MRVAAVLCTLAAAVLLPACGGGNRLTHGELAREATAICRREQGRVARITVPPLSERARASRALGHAVEVARHAISDLRALNPSKADASSVERWIAIHDQMLNEVTFAEGALHRGDEASAREVMDRAATLEGRARALARALDVGSCRLLPPVPA